MYSYTHNYTRSRKLEISIDNITSSTEPEHDASGKTLAQHFIHINWHATREAELFCIWVSVMLLLKYLTHYIRKLGIFSKVPETCWLIAFGIICGFAIIEVTGENYAKLFTPEVFFIYLLPPIIFEAGYYMPRRAFLENVHSIMTFAFLGTLINAILIGGSTYLVFNNHITSLTGMKLDITTAVLFGSIVAAVDPVAVIAVFQEVNVNILLYMCVFGESLFNDGVAVVLARAFTKLLEFEPEVLTGMEIGFLCLELVYIAVGGSLLGFLFAYVAGFVTRIWPHSMGTYEPFICMVLAYASYITAELLDMSAILSAVFCGFNMRKYVRHNMLPQSVTAFNYIVHLTAHVCEVSIFIWLGFVVAELDWTRSTDIALIAWVNAFCLVYRFMVTFSLCFVLNIWRTEKITILGQIILSFGGLRGGIAFSLMALAELPDTHLKDTLLIATISVICFTAFVQGILIEPLLDWLKIPRGEKSEEEEIFKYNLKWERFFLRKPYPSKSNPTGHRAQIAPSVAATDDMGYTNDALDIDDGFRSRTTTITSRM